MVRLAVLTLAFFICAFVADAWARTESAAFGPVVREAGFVDRFESPSFHSRWQISDGWNSGEWPSVEWRRSQVDLASPGFRFTLAPSPAGTNRPYVSGEIATYEEFLYGYFEARLRIPRGGGIVGAFFTFTRPDGNESWNEIDMEFLGRDPHRLELVYHVAGEANLHVMTLPFDASADLHTYAFEWRPNRIRWYIDNRRVHTSRGGRVAELNRPQRLFASLWNSERMPRWLGSIERSAAPWSMHVACIAHAERYEGRSLCAD